MKLLMIFSNHSRHRRTHSLLS